VIFRENKGKELSEDELVILLISEPVMAEIANFDLTSNFL